MNDPKESERGFIINFEWNDSFYFRIVPAAPGEASATIEYTFFRSSAGCGKDQQLLSYFSSESKPAMVNINNHVYALTSPDSFRLYSLASRPAIEAVWNSFSLGRSDLVTEVGTSRKVSFTWLFSYAPCVTL